MRSIRCTVLIALLAGSTLASTPAAAQFGGLKAMQLMKQVRETPSPYAGTYRVTLVQDADTVTFYARTYGTASIPMIGARPEGTSDLDRAGAFIMGFSALTTEGLPASGDVSKDERKALGGLFFMVGYAFPTPDSSTVVPGYFAAGLPKGASAAYDRMSKTLEKLNKQMQEDMKGGKPKHALGVLRFDAAGVVHVAQRVEVDGQTIVTVAERVDAANLGKAPGMF